MDRRSANAVTAAEPAVSARRFEQEDQPRVLAVLEAAFGTWPGDISVASPSDFFHWKHMASPFGRSLLLVAEREGELAGFTGYMPWRFRAGGQIVRAVRGVDYAVHPDHRRQGATVAIRMAANAILDAAFIWSNPNEPARRGAAKFGRHLLRTPPRFMRPCAPLLPTARRASAGESATAEQLAVHAPTAAELLGDAEFVADVLASITDPPGRLTTAKDLEYLRWRYGHFEDYRAVRVELDGTGCGIAIFRPREHRGLWVLDVCELLVGNGRRRVAHDLLAEVSGSAAADLLSCSFRSRRQAAAHGFFQASRATSFMAHPLQPNIEPDPTLRRSWELSRGDLELL
jgi:hypothetical protein